MNYVNKKVFRATARYKQRLRAELGIEVNYDVVHNLVHDKLKAKLKVARPRSYKQDPDEVKNFKKKLPSTLQSLINQRLKQSKQFSIIRYWCQDETHLGLKTIERRKLTIRGVKPVGCLQWSRSAYYLYGVLEPLTGASFFSEFSHLDTECFQEFLNQFSQQFPQDLHVWQLDNGAFHQAKSLRIPENIILLFQPPHCPELNPIERFWEHLKEYLKWDLFTTLDSLKDKVNNILRSLDKDVVISLTCWDYLKDALFVAQF
ncbi:IS630 family transposase [Tolypothrix sp. VBCCA 56010]|uniref:IS630 family transposase n=1 Tax=Tolypothrix sp. VBCCA 56010 TaxID=3137731 RepID=UPI003D7C4266